MKKDSIHDRQTSSFQEIDIDKLDEPEQDLRFFRSAAFEDRLLDDLRQEGAVVPVIIRPKPNTARFEILDGVSRVRSARLLGKRVVLCQIVVCDAATAIIIGLKMNIYRHSHDPVGLAKAFKTLHDQHGIKYKDIAKRFDFTASWVSKLVALTKLPREYQEAVSRGDLTIEDGARIVSGDKHAVEYFDERRDVHCEVCGRPFNALEVTSIRTCYKCKRGYEAYRAEIEKRYKSDMERAAKRLREKQTELGEP